MASGPLPNNGAVIVPGYLDGYQPPISRSPLTDGSDLMSHSLFWPMFLTVVGGSRSAPAAFDVDPADMEQILDVLFGPHRWPVFSLPLTGRCHLRVIMRNFEDDSGVDYLHGVDYVRGVDYLRDRQMNTLSDSRGCGPRAGT
jgi:hypothetical protein